MNLDTCTPDQRDIVECVDRPLLVSAGAGSGKTFTLTQRIAYALLPESGPAAGGIDEVLAITFTEKAAAEIKARVKRTLRAEGLAVEALKVDGAWISTIHGMCARILRTHALDLGLDPAFGILGDAERKDLLAAAIDDALGRDNDLVSRGFCSALFDEYPARSAGPNAASVADMLDVLLNEASNLRGGLDALDFGPAPGCPAPLARELLLAYGEVAAALEQVKPSASSEKAKLDVARAVEALEEYLSSGTGAAGDISEWRAFAQVLEGCVLVPKKFGSAETKACVGVCQEVHGRVARQVSLALAVPAAEQLMALAREVSRRYGDAKRALCKLDNDDLLVKTLEAFETHPEIAQRYERRFKLVMVDEFQDTSQLQIDMIARLAGEGFAHLCTVGDAQQSIYRFRGADVNVYNQHKDVMRSPEVGARYVELSKNFRSHRDVLSFVDRVFEQPHVFGDAFMSLEPHDARESRWQGNVPRIDVVLASHPAGRGTGVGTADAKRTAARELARRFAALREDGHAAGDMVVLLGAMTRAHVYAEALRSVGFECVIAGGSLFASAPEVRVVARLLEAVANPADTAALFEVLTSDMVRLSADDFLELSTEEDPETGDMRRRDLDRGLGQLAEQAGDLPARLAHAVRLLDDARREARILPAADVVLNAVVRSGWMARLEAEGAVGMATAANVLKAIRLVESVEKERHLGFASTARAFARELDAVKESPGALSGAKGGVVKIMTIHASKGLEFPIVGLAEFAGSSRGSKLVVETCGSVGRASLEPGRTLEGYPGVCKAAKKYDEISKGSVTAGETPDADAVSAQRFILGDTTVECSAAAYREALKQRAAREELAEARRKLYVGLTRASEALVVVMDAKEPSKGASYPDLIDDIRGALCGAEGFPDGSAELPYGGTEPARFQRVSVEAASEDAVLSEAACGSSRFLVPAPAPHVCAPEPWRAGREDVFSYSSIAPSTPVDAELLVETGIAPSSVIDTASGSGDVDSACGATPSPATDSDKATGLGSAFHRAAQFAVETGCVPGEQRLQALCRAYGLTPAQRDRLSDACARWFASATYAETSAWPLRRAEVPFFVHIGTAFMEGEIDLLCSDGPEGEATRALVVDYKTGGRQDESAETLYGKHLLQAQCYAYALIYQGYTEVELRFVRVERAGAGGELQTIRYAFTAQDYSNLAEGILAARAV